MELAKWQEMETHKPQRRHSCRRWGACSCPAVSLCICLVPDSPGSHRIEAVRSRTESSPQPPCRCTHCERAGLGPDLTNTHSQAPIRPLPPGVLGQRGMLCTHQGESSLEYQSWLCHRMTAGSVLAATHGSQRPCTAQHHHSLGDNSRGTLTHGSNPVVGVPVYTSCHGLTSSLLVLWRRPGFLG